MIRLGRVLLVLVLAFGFIGQVDARDVEVPNASVQKVAPNTSLFSRMTSTWDKLVVRAKNKAVRVKQKVKKWAKGWWNNDNKTAVAESKVLQKSEALDRQNGKTSSVSENPVVVKKPMQQQGTSSQDLAKLAGQLQGGKAFSQIRAARVGTSKIGRSRSGVLRLPKFSKKIPSLDIGEEEQIQYNQLLLSDFEYSPKKIGLIPSREKIKLMEKKEFAKILGKKAAKVTVAKELLVSMAGQNFPVTAEKIDQVKWDIKLENPVDLKSVEPMNSDDLILVAALTINSDKKACHIAVGLLNNLSASKTVRAEAGYNLALCAKEMGLYSEFISRIVDVMAQDNQEFGKLGLGAISANDHYEYESIVSNTIKSGLKKFSYPKEAEAAIHFSLAKESMRRGDYKHAISEAQKIPEKNPYWARAQYIVFTNQFLLGQERGSVKTGQSLLEWLTKNGDADKIESLVRINMGRIQFQKRKFSESNNEFLKVNKDHPLWIQGLTEQGWSQVQNKDYSGAIGNMFSIQNSFFQSVYNPESFVVRAIGYINLCQYGDAKHTVQLLDRIYKPWYHQMSSYTKKKPAPDFYYETIKKHLSQPTLKSIDGLPFQVVREMARHKDFLNLQKAINAKVDEADQWKFLERFINRDIRKLKNRLNENKRQIRLAKADIKRIKGKRTLVEEFKERGVKLAELRRLNLVLKYKIDLYSQSKKSYRELSKKGIRQLAQQKLKLRKQAGSRLERRLKRMKRELNDVLANNELLKYEVFSGSGKNIRFRVAGGAKGEKRTPATVQNNDANLKWEYEGEIWQDEIGNFRSTIVNNCPQQNFKSAKR